MASITVLLLGVSNAGNLGAVARAMKNFGLTDLMLIAPKCSATSKEALDRAKWAKDILQNARIAESLEVLNEFDLVVGTTGKLGDDYNLRRTPLMPWQIAEEFKHHSGNVALLFGREGDGLLNEELDRCDLLLSIPTSGEYPSMNLSHAVAVVLYALCGAQLGESTAKKYPLLRSPEKKKLHELAAETIDLLDFPAERENKTQQVLWQRLLGKTLLTHREGMALLGFFRRVQWKTKKK